MNLHAGPILNTRHSDRLTGKSDMKRRLPFLGMAVIFLVVQLASLSLAPLIPGEYRAFEDVDNPINPLIYIGLILLVTAIMLILIKLGKFRLIQGLLLLSMMVTIIAITVPVVNLVIHEPVVSLIVSSGVGITAVVALIYWREWFVIDAVGIIMAIGATSILGITLSPFPAIILLIIIAIYDAVAVYKTKHMLALADGIIPLGLPIAFVLPARKDFSIESVGKEKISEKTEREAVFMGLGDAVIPGILSVASYMYLPSTSLYFSNSNLLVAIGVIVGSFIGYIVLMTRIAGGRPQAGLPFLNGGALAGYFISYLVVFGNLNFGFPF